MKNFGYRAPTSITEASAILSDNGSSCYMLAGGTDLIPKMRAGRISPRTVLDVKRIPELMGIAIENNELLFGAGVSCRIFNDSADVAKIFPALRDSSNLIGGIQIQGRASIGGNLCNASPSADSIPTLIALNAKASVRRADGNHETIDVEEFCLGPGKSILQQGDLLTHISIKKPKAGEGAAYLRFTPRNEMDIAVANTAVSLTLDKSGNEIQKARIVLGAVGPTAIVAKSAGEYLVGKTASKDSFAEAAEYAAEVAKPISDMRGTVEHRKQLSRVLVQRAAEIALNRARESC